MANKSLFAALRGRLLPTTDTTNEAGGSAYAFTPKHALAQYAVTGCLNGTYYASAETQLERVLELANGVDAEFVARTAVYARRDGYMKDMPALLCAVLAQRDGELLERTFPLVIDNAKMLRNFVQIVRSGVTGRRSLGSRPKRLVQRWLDEQSEAQLFVGSVGQSPSLADVVRMVHPKPSTDSRRALYAYLVGRDYVVSDLPQRVREFEAFKLGHTTDVPDVPFQLLSSLNLGRREWTEIARQAPYQMTRMNLNTFLRHGVFDDKRVTKLIAQRLQNREAIRKARVFPYQLMTAWKNASEKVPFVVRDALQSAMEVATQNVPKLAGQVYVCVDVSGSMQSPATGYRQGATSSVRCVDVAALVAAAVMRTNPKARVLPFDTSVVSLKLNPRDSIVTNAAKLASVYGGGTSVSAPLRQLNKERARGSLVVIVSDNESWADKSRGRGTALMQEWSQFKQRNQAARLVCIDIQPYASTQAQENEDIVNVGGFSDRVFDILALANRGQLSGQHWVSTIENVGLN